MRAADRTVVSYGADKSRRQYRTALLISICAAAATAIVSVAVRSIHDEISIDVRSGDLRTQRLFFGWAFSESIEQTIFTKAARDAGFVPTIPPEWSLTEIRYHYRRPVYENSRASNTP